MKTIWRSACTVIVALALPWFAGLRVNLTPSMPEGLYRLEHEDALRRGDLVSVCLTAAQADPLNMAERYLRRSALCPSGIMPLLKHVAALPGDSVSVDADGIRVNGLLWPGSPLRSADAQGRPLLSLLASSLTPSGTVPPGMALVLGDHADSFDSRYFGSTPLAACRKVSPLIIFNE